MLLDGGLSRHRTRSGCCLLQLDVIGLLSYARFSCELAVMEAFAWLNIILWACCNHELWLLGASCHEFTIVRSFMLSLVPRITSTADVYYQCGHEIDRFCLAGRNLELMVLHGVCKVSSIDWFVFDVLMGLWLLADNCCIWRVCLCWLLIFQLWELLQQQSIAVHLECSLLVCQLIDALIGAFHGWLMLLMLLIYWPRDALLWKVPALAAVILSFCLDYALSCLHIILECFLACFAGDCLVCWCPLCCPKGTWFLTNTFGGPWFRRIALPTVCGATAQTPPSTTTPLNGFIFGSGDEASRGITKTGFVVFLLGKFETLAVGCGAWFNRGQVRLKSFAAPEL